MKSWVDEVLFGKGHGVCKPRSRAYKGTWASEDLQRRHSQFFK